MMVQIAIDGPAGVGKSTAARRVAAALGCVYVDTGAMYRAVGLFAQGRGADLDDEAAVLAAMGAMALDLRFEGGQRVYLNGADVTDDLRTPACGLYAAAVARHPDVRRRLVAEQRRLAAGRSVVMDGRDIGTVVLPDATLKVYLTADVAKLAERRCAELAAKGIPHDPARIAEEIAARVKQDLERPQSHPARDAVVVDTAELGEEQVTEKILALLAAK